MIRLRTPHPTPVSTHGVFAALRGGEGSGRACGADGRRRRASGPVRGQAGAHGAGGGGGGGLGGARELYTQPP